LSGSKPAKAASAGFATQPWAACELSAARFFQDQWGALRSGRVGEVTPCHTVPTAICPASVQANLPPHAQDIYREAFNHAFAAHAGDPRQEEVGGGQALVREGRRQLDRPRPNLT
jgi:hypothetical protein